MKHAEDYIGRSEILAALRWCSHFSGTPSNIRTGDIRETEITTLLKTIGRKGKTRWEAKRSDVLASLLEAVESGTTPDGSDTILLQIGSNRPILEIVVPNDAESLSHELQLRLKSNILEDRSAEQEIKQIEMNRWADLHAQLELKHSAGKERIREHIRRLRQGIRTIAPLWEIDTYPLSDIDEIKVHLESLRAIQRQLSTHGTRSGNVDRLVDTILHDYDLHSIHDAPELLSSAGCLIDAHIGAAPFTVVHRVLVQPAFLCV